MPEFTEDMTEDEFYELLEKALKVLVDMIYREYTVNVSYQDAQTSYKINFKNIWRMYLNLMTVTRWFP